MIEPIRAGELDRKVRIETPTADNSFSGAGSGTWTKLDDIWASVRDVMPARGEQLRDGARVATARAKVRLYWRPDLTSACRFVAGDRVMEIVAGPVEIGRRQGFECIVEDYTPAGNPA